MNFNLSSDFYNQLAKELAEPLIKHLQVASKASKATTDTEPPLTVKEAAKWLKTCDKTILTKINNCQIPASNIGTCERPKYLIAKADLVNYFNASRKY